MSACTAAPAARPWSCPGGRLVLRADAPRELWLRKRRTGIGSSDASAILGVNRWTSPYEVWCEKRGLLPPEPDNEAMDLGRRLEPIVVDWWAEQAGIPVRRAGLMANLERPWQLASVDRLAACGGIVEAKTLSWRVAEEWEEGQTPDHAEVQVQHQLAVTGRSHAHVVGLQDGRTWLERTVARDDQLGADLSKIEAEFWQLVLDGVEPPVDGSAATTEALAARWPGIVETETELGREGFDLVAFREKALGHVREFQQAADLADNKLRALMGEATVGWLPGDPEDPRRPKVTWRRNGTFASKRFTSEHPELATAYTRPLPQLDVAALKAGEPELHQSYRARVLRVPKLTDTKGSTD